ncbi:hypothetical protein CQW23_20039 [Capsicum baccatum]|uniref:Uncharacterized protein n=1 Tax=Capsicum baccatum TaxID=33114 RepID=A0A2G2W7G9_CAPBA|nr:hypothetical protein CQW23_20039 [Capsicum baccatum]
MVFQHDDSSETGEDEMAEASKVTEINSKRKKEYLVLTGWSAVSRHHYLQGKGEDGESCSDEDSSEDEENQTARGACASFIFGFMTFMSIEGFPSFGEDMKIHALYDILEKTT